MSDKPSWELTPEQKKEYNERMRQIAKEWQTEKKKKAENTDVPDAPDKGERERTR